MPNPGQDIGDDFGRHCLFDAGVLVAKPGGAVLEQVVKPWIEPAVGGWAESLYLAEIELRNHLAVFVAVKGKARAFHP